MNLLSIICDVYQSIIHCLIPDAQQYLFHNYIVEPDLRLLDEDGLGHQDEIFLAAGFPADGSGGGRAGHGGEEGGEGESEDEGWYSLSRTDVR